MIRKAKLWSPEQAFKQAKAIERAIQQAVRDTLTDHKRSGDPIVVCDNNGTVRWIRAEEIEIPELPEGST